MAEWIGEAPGSEDDPLSDGGFPPTRTWGDPGLPNPGGGVEYGDMIAELRHFLDAVAAAPAPATSAGLAADLAAWSEKLAPLAVEERRAVFARRLGLPGRGQTMSPALVVEGGDRDSVHGTVTFGRYYLGGGGAVHGGAVPLLFDEVLGRLAQAGGRVPCRTAYLHTDYRSITPVGVELQVRGPAGWEGFWSLAVLMCTS